MGFLNTQDVQKNKTKVNRSAYSMFGYSDENLGCRKTVRECILDGAGVALDERWIWSALRLRKRKAVFLEQR